MPKLGTGPQKEVAGMAQTKRITRKQVQESLLQQLAAKGADVPHFEALVRDYLEYFDLVTKLKQDIRKRGLTYPAISATGKEYEKDNPSVKLLPQYTKAMLVILRELGLTTDEPIETEDDEL